MAVTASFFVENLREQSNDLEQERQLIKIQLEDIRLDTAQLNYIITNRLKRMTILDSLTYLINSSKREIFLKRIYFYGRHPTRLRDLYFAQNRRTFDQIRNSGGSKLISNLIVSETIDRYYAKSDLVRDLENRERNYVDLYLPSSYKIFDGLEFDEMIDNQSKLIQPKGNPKLLPNIDTNLQEFNAALHNVKSVNVAIMQDQKKLLELAQVAITKINNEYQ